MESKSGIRGERFLHGAPGVYLHNDANRDEADYYCKIVKLEPKGLFYAATWQVMVNRQGCVKVPRPTDQWVQRAYGVKLRALWLCCRTPEEMYLGDPSYPLGTQNMRRIHALIKIDHAFGSRLRGTGAGPSGCGDVPPCTG